MSLKAFHVVFVTLATLMSLGFGIWAWRDFGRSGQTGSAIVSVMAFVGCVALLLYGVWFLRKLRGVSWL